MAYCLPGGAASPGKRVCKEKEGLMTRPDWLPKDGGTFWRRNPALAAMAEHACREAIEDTRQAAVDEALARWIQPGQLAMWQVSA